MRRLGLILGVSILVIAIAIILFPILFSSKSREYQEVEIPGDGYTLKGYISVGKRVNNPWIVMTHGNRREGQAHPLNELIRQNISDNVSVLAIDFRGFGQSHFGEISEDQTILYRVPDIDAAVNYLKDLYGISEDDIILLGHSLGAVQILSASNTNVYKMIIAIGPGDFNIFIDDSKQMKSYIDKFYRNTGVTMTSETMVTEGSQIVPEKLFATCSSSPTVMIFGSSDNPETLIFHRDRIPDQCEANIEWITIPFSDHMYRTESSLPRPIRFYLSRTSVSFLMWRINGLFGN